MLKIDLRPEPRILRQFAWITLLGMPLLCWLVLRSAGTFHWTHPALLVAGGFALAQVLLFELGVHAITRWLFVVMTVLTLPIGFVVSHVLMAVIYYLVMTPIALVFRAMGRDVIGRRLDPGATSYWHLRAGPRSASSYFKLY